MTLQSSGETGVAPDPSWRGLYRAGGISAILIGVLFIVAIVFIAITPQAPSSGGISTLQYIAANRSIYIIGQILGIPSIFLGIVALLALFVALKHFNKNHAAIGSLVAIVAQLLPLAYLTFGSLVYLSDQYAAATTEAQRTAFATAAEGFIAVNNAVSAAGVDPILTAGAIGILILSLVMLKGVFHKGVAYLGIVAGALGIISALGIFIRPLANPPPLGIGYIFYGVLNTAWFVAVGYKLYKLGRD